MVYYRDIEVEEGEDPMPYLGDAGFYSYAQSPQIEADPAHDVNPPAEIPFVPQSMLEDDLQPELPPPPARGPRHIQGDIRLPANVRDEIAHAEGDNLKWKMFQNASSTNWGGYMISTNLKQDPHPQHNHSFRSPQHHFSVSLHQKRVKRWRKL